MTRISTCIFLIFFIVIIICNITSADRSNIKRNTRSRTVKIGDSCQTFNKNRGICTNKCEDNLYTKKTSTRAEKAYIRTNKCRKNIKNGYCCSKNVIETTATIRKFTPTEAVNLGDQCKTYQNKIGTCTTKINTCQEEIFTKKKLGRREYRIKNESSCGKPTEKAFCCTTTVAIRQPDDSDITIANRKLDKFDNTDSLKLLPNATICGHTNEERIVGGNVTGLADYPWMALLKYKNLNGVISYKCGGSLINDRYVLTAAHCLAYSRNSEFMNEVRLGEFDLSSSEDCKHNTCSDQPLDIGVEETIKHDKYTHRVPMPNDIALLRLNAKVIYTDYIKPVCLPIETELLSKRSYDEIELTVVGWGNTEDKKSSNKKLYVKLKGVTIDKCNETYKFPIANKLNNQTQLCAGGDGKHDSCTGDSGGPLMHRDLDAYTPNWTIIGIVSFGVKECAEFGKPAVYTRVDGFMPWILKYIHE